MPRRRTTTDSPAGDALDQAAREHERAEKAYDVKRQALHQRIREAYHSGMSISEIARRAGYTREHVSSLINDPAKAKPA